jgi:hypothetical protein
MEEIIKISTSQMYVLIVWFISLLLNIDLAYAVNSIDYSHWKKKNKIPIKSKSAAFEKEMRMQHFKKVFNFTTLLVIALPIVNTIWYVFSLLVSMFRPFAYGTDPMLKDVARARNSLHSYIFIRWKPGIASRNSVKAYLDGKDKEYAERKK